LGDVGGLLQVLAEAEVGHFYEVVVEEDVVGFEVAVHYVQLRQDFEGL
jgi:hypothetical protein